MSVSPVAEPDVDELSWPQTAQDKMNAVRAEMEKLRAAVEEVKELKYKQLSQYDEVRHRAANMTAASDAPAAFQSNWLWLIDPPSAGYSAPTLTEALPEYLLSDAAKTFMAQEGRIYYKWNTADVIKWAMYVSISRKLVDRSTQIATGFNSDSEALPFNAVWDDDIEKVDVANVQRNDGMAAADLADLKAHARHDNSPQPYWVPWLGEARAITGQRAWFYPWLGCRCSWPCTQLCWWQMMSCGLFQHAAIIWSIITIAFEFTVLDAIVVDDFIAKVPNRIVSWDDYAHLNTSVASRAATLFVYFIFPWFVVGFLFASSSSSFGNLHAYYNGETPGRCSKGEAGGLGQGRGLGEHGFQGLGGSSAFGTQHAYENGAAPEVLGERDPAVVSHLQATER
eukprot:scaffold7979_cov129-Isochrysis_galbana.AAC.4